MDLFRTTLRPTLSKEPIRLSDRLLTLGSCFADSIGSRLLNSKISTLSNPFGVAYNPLAIHKILRYCIFNAPVPTHTFLQQGDVYLNYDFHSEISSLSRSDLERHLQEKIGAAHHFLKDAEWLILTLGTAWLYTRNENGEPVANCHKQPAATFTKSLLTQKKILSSFDDVYKELKQFNPDIKIILTVSPVRHVKDTLELNSVSKSVLRMACHTLQETYAGVEYFPAFEIMMDDLRDYQFYKRDRIHPTEEAEDYIWEQFVNRYADTDLKSFLEKWKGISQALHHNAFHARSAGHQKFLQETLRKLEELNGTVNVDEEVDFIRRQIIV